MELAVVLAGAAVPFSFNNQPSLCAEMVAAKVYLEW
jgi:hypothetical protein